MQAPAPQGPKPAELSPGTVRTRAVRGVALLLVRNFVLRMVGFAGSVALARLLLPREFGVYAVVTFVVNSVGMFTDLGLSAGLIQRREEPTLRELRTIFLVQQLMVGSVVLGLVLLAGPITGLYHGRLGPGGANLIRVLSLSLLLASFGSISSTLLERRLEFHKRTIADVVQTLTYTVLAVFLALHGFGVWAFVLAALASNAAGLVSLFSLAPWPMGWAMDRQALRRLVKFGLPFQAATVLSLVKDNTSPTLIALVAGAAAVGAINLAESLTYLPLILISIVGRVTFPAFARLQDDPARLRQALEVSVRWVSLGTFPAILLLVAMAPQVVHYVYTPRTQPGKWDAAILPIYLFSLPALASSYSTTFINALYAVGRASFMLRLTLIFTVAGWGLALPLVLLLPQHYLGYPIAMALITPFSVLSVREVRKVVQPRFVGWSLVLLACAGSAALVTRAVANLYVHDLVSMVLVLAMGAVLYSVLVLALRGRFLIAEGRTLFAAARN